MKSDVLIVYGSLNSVPSPEGAAPAKVIFETVESLNDSRFKVLSNYNPKLKSFSYNRDVFRHVRSNFMDTLVLWILKLIYPYKKRKQKFITSADKQLLYFISVCRFLFFNGNKKIIVHVSVGLVNMIKLFFPKREVVFFHHGTSLHTKYNEQQWLELISNSKAIFGVNKIALEKANNTFSNQLKTTRYFGIPNAIVPKVTLEQSIGYYKNRSYGTNTFVFAFSGRICVEKGVLNLLKAFQQVYDQNKNVRLIVFGGAGAIGKYDKKTSYIEKCLNFSEDHKLPIEFTGYIENNDLIKSLSQIDTLILPTDNKRSEEGMPLCLIEAISLGKPIIATNSGGNSEVVEDNVNGYLINSNPYIDELAEAMLKMSLDKARYAKFSKAAYASYIENHTYKKYTKKFTDILSQISYIENGKR
ncbi:glycosyltransferase family 4 protein [Winogradskyella schleiferi]|uniref:glycosyltransferase family 4 protein n=1 Tax=Winogradskyella schleiferi TaxID=2686078 RepID=UPI0015BB3E96|nr:glycosyltransferase family 4 protein [Winogradskyella schleiferi]